MAEQVNKEEVVGPQQVSENVNVDTPTITAGDLKMMVTVIDVGSQRGSWKGEELATLGTLRNKLAAVLQSVAPQTEETAEQDGETNQAA